jgi:hypothetical protein
LTFGWENKMQYNFLDDPTKDFPDKFHIQSDTLGLNFLLTQTTCWIIMELDNYEQTGELANKELKIRYNMASHGYVNHIFSGVKLLFDFVKAYKTNKNVKSLLKTEIISEALVKFKKFKDTKRIKEIAEFGENFGSDTWYVKWDPTEDINEWHSYKGK